MVNKRGSGGEYVAPWERQFDRILTPLEHFIHRQTTSGILLMICAVVALLIANSDWRPGYEHFLHTDIGFSFGQRTFALSVHHWINEALMAMFFFVMGLELKRELLVGELASPSQAALPIIAAIGGMVVPAAAYFAVAGSGEFSAGWGIPMATDIAFAVGAISLLGARVPRHLLTFLIALAIVDDLGAVAVIAVFYTADVDGQALVWAIVATGLLFVLNRGGVRRILPYGVVGIALWLAMLASGIHATLAGIVLAFTIPMRPKYEPDRLIDKVQGLTEKMLASYRSGPDIIRNSEFRSQVIALGDGVALSQAPAQRLEHQLHIPVAYLVIPVFALANAGVPLGAMGGGSVLAHPVTLGILAGLVLGKLVGIAGFSYIAVRAKWCELPEGVTMPHIVGVALLGGIGFTMSIFIADLAFISAPQSLLAAKAGILLASLISGLSGFFWLYWCGRESSAQP